KPFFCAKAKITGPYVPTNCRHASSSPGSRTRASRLARVLGKSVTGNVLRVIRGRGRNLSGSVPKAASAVATGGSPVAFPRGDDRRAARRYEQTPPLAESEKKVAKRAPFSSGSVTPGGRRLAIQEGLPIPERGSRVERNQSRPRPSTRPRSRLRLQRTKE